MLPKIVFFINFVTAISCKPTPEIRFLSGQLRWTLLSHGRYSCSIRDRVLNHPTFQLRGGHSTTTLSPPQRNVRRQCLGVR